MRIFLQKIADLKKLKTFLERDRRATCLNHLTPNDIASNLENQFFRIVMLLLWKILEICLELGKLRFVLVTLTAMDFFCLIKK